MGGCHDPVLVRDMSHDPIWGRDIHMGHLDMYVRADTCMYLSTNKPEFSGLFLFIRTISAEFCIYTKYISVSVMGSAISAAFCICTKNISVSVMGSAY